MLPKNTQRTSVFRLASSIAFVSLCLGCVSASEGTRLRGDIDALDARFAELSASMATERARLSELIETAEAEIASLQSAIGEAEGLLRRTNADFGGQMEGVETDLQSLRGQVERAEFGLNQLQEQLNLLVEDIDMRLGN